VSEREPQQEINMMKLRVIGGLLALSLSASAVAAQQPQAPPMNPHRAPAGARGEMPMMMMDSLNRRLDSLVAQMNRASGNQKMDAMAAVITELVAQRKMMQNRMHQMMQGEVGRMGMMRDSTGPKPTAKSDSAPDTTDHAAHHPPK
jgi:TolA-binding protein